MLATYGKISSEFDDLKNASWLVTSYVLAVSAVQPIVSTAGALVSGEKKLSVANAVWKAK